MVRTRASHRLFAIVVATVTALGGAWFAATAAQAGAPSVTITAPANGDTVKETVHITVTAVGNSSDDPPDYVDFYVDTQPDQVSQVGEYDCDQVSVTCYASYDWDTTGISGTHTLYADEVMYSSSQVVTSQPVTVKVDNPPPDITITSPTDGDVVNGKTTVAYKATTDPKLDSKPYQVFFRVDQGRFQVIGGCGDDNPCSGHFPWRAGALIGSHTLTMKVTDTYGGSGISAPVTVNVHAGTTIKPDRPPTVATGHRLVASGTILSGRSAAAGLPVSVTMTPVGGHSQRRATTTDSEGHYSVSFTAADNALISVRTAGSGDYGASATSYKQKVRGELRCRFDHSTTTPKKKDFFTCRLPGLPRRAGYSVQYHQDGWEPVDEGRTTRVGIIRTWIVFDSDHPYSLRVQAYSNAVWAATISNVMTVHVRG